MEVNCSDWGDDKLIGLNACATTVIVHSKQSSEWYPCMLGAGAAMIAKVSWPLAPPSGGYCGLKPVTIVIALASGDSTVSSDLNQLSSR